MDQQTHPNYPQNNPPLPLATKRPTTTTTITAKLPNNPKPMKPKYQPPPTQLSISTATASPCYHHSQPSRSKCILLREYESGRGDRRGRREVRVKRKARERRLKREKKKFTKKKRETWNKKPFSYNFLATNITCFLEHFHQGFQKSSILQPQNLLYLSNWSLKFKN